MQRPDHLGVYVTSASRHIRRSLDGIFSQYPNLNGAQACVLNEIYRNSQLNRPYYQKDIELHFGIRRSSANTMISALEQHGYVLRTQVKEDARLKQLTLTSQGEHICIQIQQSLDEFEHSLSSLYTVEERELLISLLLRLIEHCPDSRCSNPALSETDSFTEHHKTFRKDVTQC